MKTKEQLREEFYERWNKDYHDDDETFEGMFDGYWDTHDPDLVWDWIEENYVPKSEVNELETELSLMLEHFTGLSNTNYSAKQMIRDIEDETYDKDSLKDDIRSMLDGEDLVGSLRGYFDLED
jgi:hypothetical protein